MFGNLFKTVFEDKPRDEPAPDHRVAYAALLVRLARVDETYDPAEEQIILSILSERYRLNAEEALLLLQRGKALEQSTGDTVHLTKAIKGEVPYEERSGVIQDLWSVALADNVRDHQENAFLRLVAKLLGVNDVESAHARQRAARAVA